MRKDLGAPRCWEPGCALVVEHVEVVQNSTTGKMYIRATLRNVSAKGIDAAALAGVARAGDEDENIEFANSIDAACRPGEDFCAISKAIELDEVDVARIHVRAIVFSDKIAWTSSEDEEPLPNAEALELSDIAAQQREKELLKLYGGNREKVEAARANKTLTDVNWWLCSCGAINAGRDDCWRCGGNKSRLIAAQDIETLEKLANEEREKKQEDERKKQELKEKLVKYRPKIIGGCVALVFVVAVGVLAVTVFVPIYHSNAANDARQRGDWDVALAEYDAANGWGESVFYTGYTKCLKALSENKDAGTALQEFLAGDFDLSNHVDDMLALGQAYADAERFDDAVSCYEALSGLTDANGRIYEAYSAAADSFLDKNMCSSAVNMLSLAKEHRQDEGSFTDLCEKGAKIMAERNEYKLAVRALELSAENDAGKKKVFDMACEGGRKAVESGELDLALSLFKTAGNYGDASGDIMRCENMQKLKTAEKEFQAGNLSAAQNAFNELPADLTFNGVNAGERQSLLSSRQEFVDMVGKYTGSNHSKVTQTSKRSSSSKWWENDYPRAVANVSCKISDDGTVRVSGDVTFYRYTKFSVISSGLDGNSDKKTFAFDTSETPESVDIGGNTTISISGGEFTLDYYKLEENRDIYFNYEYESSGTLKK